MNFESVEKYLSDAEKLTNYPQDTTKLDLADRLQRILPTKMKWKQFVSAVFCSLKVGPLGAKVKTEWNAPSSQFWLALLLCIIFYLLHLWQPETPEPHIARNT